MKPTPTAYSLVLLLLAGPACEEVRLLEDGASNEEPAVERAAKAPPVFGGTLLVTSDGKYAVVADPPRDSIHIVDLTRWEETGTIELDDGALPFRAAEDDAGRVHITLRGTGEIVAVDPRTAEITETTSVCPNPRGIAFDDASGALHVACAGGLLATLTPFGETTRRYIAPDLRDVFVSESRLFVTRFRAAEVLEVEEDGTWSLAGAPISLASGFGSRQPTTAWRTLPRPELGWVMLHQSASAKTVPEFQEPTDDGDGSPPSGYGGEDPCSAATSPTLSATLSGGQVRTSGVLGGVALVVDAALSPDGRRIALASPTQQDRHDDFFRAAVFEVRLDSLEDGPDVDCRFPDPLSIDDDAVAVAYQPDGALLAQARDEPVLYRIRDGETETLELTGADASDTGFDLFHNDAGSGVSCASCHPEGGEDGRTWIFDHLGPRRTQALNVGLEGTAPFHWKGDMDDIHMIARRVRQGAMGGEKQSEERQVALQDWLFTLRPPNPLRSEYDESVMRGRALFGSLGCASCHAGESFTSPASADLGRGPLQTPALRGVALRAPYMHDGRSSTLTEAVVDMATSTSHPDLGDDEIASLVAYLESL